MQTTNKPQPLSLSQFIQELRELSIEWVFEARKAIRTIDGYCPICALARAKGLNDGVFKLAFEIPAAQLGLSQYDAFAIANSSDNVPYVQSSELRRDLESLVK